MYWIDPKFVTIDELLSKKLFSIPSYQRQYSWTNHERKALFDDIKKVDAKGEEGSHFMATVVCSQIEEISLGTEIYKKLYIVDGQQRLTTLIILLKAIQLELDSNCDDQDAKDEAKKIQDRLVKPRSDSLLLLQTNHDNSFYFYNFLKDGKASNPDDAKTLADQEILRAIDDCKSFVKNWCQNKKSLLRLTHVIKNKLTVISHEITDEKIVYTVFEVLNSRGLAVSWLDRLKSFLMGQAYELEVADNKQLIEELQDYWREIYSKIGLNPELDSEVLRFAASLYADAEISKPLSESKSVSMFQEKSVDAESIKKIVNFF